MVLLAIVGLGAFYYIFKDSLFGSGSSGGPSKLSNGLANGNGKIGPAGAFGAGAGQGNGAASAGRDLAKAMKLAVREAFV